MIKILGLGTYPITQPAGGGQFRVEAIANAYQAHGIAYKYFCLFNYHQPGLHPDADCSAIVNEDAMAITFASMPPVGAQYWPYQGNGKPTVEVVDCALNILRANRDMMRILQDFAKMLDPQYIQIEQHWMIEVAKYLIDQKITPNAQIIYSGQNDETSLFHEQMIANKSAWTERLSERARSFEAMALQEAVLTIAVSDEDAHTYARNTPNPVIVARNGSMKGKTSDQACADWAELSKDFSRYFVFSSSAHAPNYQGFKDLLGPYMGFLPPDVRIVVAGTVNQLFQIDATWAHKGFVEKRCLFTGFVDAPLFAAILGGANGILLPIAAGSGSNLKTAEALFYNCPIVATDFAFRGFEESLPDPSITIANDKAGFIQAINDILANPQPVQPRQCKNLTWLHCLAPMVEAVTNLAKSDLNEQQ